ncbi:AMP-binding protein [Enterococcus termitis]|uniref:AMP-dependent synthetase/ligase domain-containing protein n=1 Tax=Enterococcus termitis TaxID=332950 RepID=A0A1E5G8U1_9ENTE|nr:AMP-binding protein [Enterococcus termitis]OEG09099.1 hypothetical protein BCR25_11040 [Enterococcus termitis]OJG98553.1 hypothetical protein RV18_GL002976 [Enterococcus termitis]
MEEKILEIANYAKNKSLYYAEKYLNYEIKNIDDFYKLPLSDSKMFLEAQENLLTTQPNPKNSYVFSTGGSLGKPKNVHVSFEEFHRNISFHGLSYNKAGIGRDDRVATFGIPGTKTSEFSVYLGLEKTGCFILPIGVHDDFDYIYHAIKEHNINTLLVMPTDLLTFVNYLNQKKYFLEIEKIITGGEALASTSKLFLSDSIGVKFFGSTFQGMDFGTIGYNNGSKDSNVYCINNDDLFIEVLKLNEQGIDKGGEIVVTNISRRLSPVVRYKTGDYGLKFFENNKMYIKVLGRVGSKPKIGGEIFNLDILDRFIENKSFYTGRHQTVISKENNVDKVLIKIETILNTDFSYQSEKERLNNFLKENHPKLESQLLNNYIESIDFLFENEKSIKFHKSENTKKIIKVIDER